MDKNSTFFYLAGGISLSLFTLFFSLFIYMIYMTPKVKKYTLKKDSYLSVSIEIPEVVTHKKENKSVSSSKALHLPKHISSIESKNIDVTDLFDNVWTKKIPHAKKKHTPLNKEIIHELRKKIKIKRDIKSKPLVDNREKFDYNEVNTSVKRVVSNGEVNEYLAKINSIVYQHFMPPQNSQGYSVKAVIELSMIGKLIDFRILTYSANEALNRECENIYKRLRNTLFPVNPEKKSSRTIVILRSKEE